MRTVRGFTLIEMVIVLIVLGIVGSLAATMLSSGFDTYMTARQMSATANVGKIALMRMARDLRDIDPGDMVTTTATTLEFSNVAGTAIRYRRVGTELRRREGTGTERVALDNCQNAAAGLQFSYFEQDGVTPTTVANDVYSVQIQLTLENPQFGTAGYTESMETIVFLRNLR